MLFKHQFYTKMLTGRRPTGVHVIDSEHSRLVLGVRFGSCTLVFGSRSNGIQLKGSTKSNSTQHLIGFILQLQWPIMANTKRRADVEWKKKMRTMNLWEVTLQKYHLQNWEHDLCVAYLVMTQATMHNICFVIMDNEVT